jgi:hypothetical protein
MADVKITGLPAASALASADLIEVVQGGANKQASVGLLPFVSKTNSIMTVLTRAPTVTDDSSGGYAVGSFIVNSNSGLTYIARSVTVGAAAWEQLGVKNHPGYVAGRAYLPSGIRVRTDASQTTSLAQNKFAGFIAPINERITIASFGISVTVAQAGGLAQVALYKVDDTTKKGAALICSTPSFDCSTTGRKFMALTTPTQVEPGFYMFVICQGGATTPTFQGTDLTDNSQHNYLGTPEYTSDVFGALTGVTYTGTFGTWAATMPAAITYYVSVPAIAFVVASAP